MGRHKKESAGLLVYRKGPNGLELFLVHPGGPFFTNKDAGSWTIPKGEIEEDQAALEVARREFFEETGQPVEAVAGPGELVPLGTVRQRGGKTVHVWAFEGDWPAGMAIASNTFSLEWPPRSGRMREFPEVDRAEFFGIEEAREKINPAQQEFIDRLIEHLRTSG